MYAVIDCVCFGCVGLPFECLFYVCVCSFVMLCVVSGVVLCVSLLV